MSRRSSTPPSPSAAPLSASVRRAAAVQTATGPPGSWYSIEGTGRRPELVPRGTVDAPEELLGTGPHTTWRGIALAFPARIAAPGPDLDGTTRPAADAVGYVLDSAGRCGVAVATDDRAHPIDAVGVTGLVADVAHRMLGLDTDPEHTDPSALIVASWLQRLLDVAADPERSSEVASWRGAVTHHPAWATETMLSLRALDVLPTPDELVDLTELLAWHLPWDDMRRRAACGSIEVSGLRPTDAAWMDWPFFARWTLGVHRPVTELLDDLSLFLDGPVYRDVRYTVAAVGWLGFAGSRVS